LVAILSPLGLYGGNRKSKIPLLANKGYMPLEGEFGNLSSLHRTDTQRPQPCLALTQALRSRRVSSASKSPDCVVAHRSGRCSSPVRSVHTGQTHQSDRSGAVASLSSILRSWLCGSTKEPSGFLVNHRKPRELGIASANRHS
jgi:hypothetical protein